MLKELLESDECFYISELNQWISELLNQRISKSLNQRIIESANQWISESANHWTRESANHWIRESANQRIIESANQRISESLNQRTSESLNQLISESTNHWIRESLNQRIIESENHWISESANHWISESLTHEWSSAAQQTEPAALWRNVAAFTAHTSGGSKTCLTIYPFSLSSNKLLCFWYLMSGMLSSVQHRSDPLWRSKDVSQLELYTLQTHILWQYLLTACIK